MKILTFDIEDWFHLLDNISTKTDREWSNYESRLELGVDRILRLLELRKQKATFFCLGWISRKHPEIVRNISSLGHEIGCHGDMHQLISDQSRQEFKEDLKRAMYTIEDLLGEKIVSYRAPGFSFTPSNTWMITILAELGIKIDCSVFPAQRSHGGYPLFAETRPCLIEHRGQLLKEFPINVIGIFNKRIVFSGGGYFRLFPFNLIRYFSAKSNYLMTYLHPRDFDPEQPIISDLPLIRKFKSYYGLNSSYNKLSKWLSEFSFVDVRTANTLVDWDSVKTVRL